MVRESMGEVLMGGLARLRRIGLVACVATLLTAQAGYATVGGEVEPNHLQANATIILHGETGMGAISPIAEVDTWVREDGLTGQLVFAYVDTNGAANGGVNSQNSEFAVRDDDFTLFASDLNDGPPPAGLGSVIAGAAVPQDGDVFFRIRETGNNHIITEYYLYQVLLDPAESAAESELNDSPAVATPISAPLMTGNVAAADVDFFSFSALAGDRIVVIMDDDPDKDGFLTDTELEIRGPDGLAVLADGDDNSGNDANAAGAIIAMTDGTYYVRVAAGGLAPDTGYSFTVLVEDEPVCLDADADGICDGLDPCAGIGDSDADGICDDVDNCPDESNPGQEDADANGTGDACEAGEVLPEGDPCGGMGGLPLAPMALMGVGMVRRKRSVRRR